MLDIAGQVGSVVAKLGLPLALAGAMAAPLFAVQREAPTTPYPGGRWMPGPVQPIMIQRDVRITMDDGVTLAATVVRPMDPATGQPAKGGFPVIIEHTPYVDALAKPDMFFARHGYIYAAVQARGTGASGGELQRFSPRDAMDGSAVTAWAARGIAGADGRVGLIGCSYPGVMALNTASRIGKGSPIKAVVAACAGLSLNRATLSVAGMPTTSFWNFLQRSRAAMGDTPAVRRFFDHIERDMKAGGEVAYERTFWLQRAAMRQAPAIAANGIPVLQWSGWRDTNSLVALRTFTALQNAHAGRHYCAVMRPTGAATARYQIVMGDWAHGEGLDQGVFLQWFETWLRGVDTGLQATSMPVHVFETGTRRWLNLPAFPPVERYTKWQLDRGGALTAGSAAAGNAVLALGDPATSGRRLRFETPPMAAGATLSGPVAASIYASSSNTNLRLIARLYDIDEAGGIRLVSKGAVLGSQRRPDPRMSWSDGGGAPTSPWPILTKDEYLRPGRVYRFDIAMDPLQHAVLPGHRLRLDLTTQTPSDICPEAGIPAPDNNDVCRATAPQAATLGGGVYSIRFGASQPSALYLPLLPFRAQRPAASGPAPSPARPGDRFTLPVDWGRTADGP